MFHNSICWLSITLNIFYKMEKIRFLLQDRFFKNTFYNALLHLDLTHIMTALVLSLQLISG